MVWIKSISFLSLLFPVKWEMVPVYWTSMLLNTSPVTNPVTIATHHFTWELLS